MATIAGNLASQPEGLFRTTVSIPIVLQKQETGGETAPIPTLHTLLHSVPIKSFIYKLTDCFFIRCSNHPNPLIRHIGNYSLADLLHQYPKYRHKRTKHILL